MAFCLLALGAVVATSACASTAEGDTAKAPTTAAASNVASGASTTTSAASKATSGAPKHPPAPQPPLFQQALPNVKNRTFTSRIVEFPPSGHAAPHRHGKAFVYAYVLDGTVRSKLDGEPARTYHKGQNWVEQPGAHHVTTENTSRTAPARLLVVFVSRTGDELKVDDPPK